MKAIGVRELKAQLSRYLREVQSGEIVLVTDRGRVVAELRAPVHATPRESDADRRLRHLAARLPLLVREPHDAAAYRPSPLHLPEGTAQAALDAERRDR